MRKEIILLAASRKHKNLCIAGIDTITGEWIRIVSEDSTISYAVNIGDIIDKDGRVPGIFDIVSIECGERLQNYYHPRILFINRVALGRVLEELH